MKILHIYKDLYPLSTGGVEHFIDNLSSGLANRGVQSDAVGTHKGPFLELKRGTSLLSYYPRTINLFSCPISLNFFTQFQEKTKTYDLLHYHFPWPFADLLHFVLHIQKPFIISYHSDIIKQKFLQGPYNPLMRKFFSAAKQIVTASENLKYSSPHLEDFQSKTLSIPYGLNNNQYQDPLPELLQTWKNTIGEQFFLFIGVLRYYKGLHYLLDAVRNTSIKVVIIGSGPEEAQLKKRIQSEHLSNVKMVGAVSNLDKVALIKLSRAIISPAHLRSEAFCISLLEGLMYGKPLISTELDTGTSFVNAHNISGIVVPPASPIDLKNAMLKLLNDQAFYDKIVLGTKSHYSQYFIREQMLDSYQKIYEDAIRK